ncbi:hypothetical protein [Laspinema palackyanum]|uniref:hypothetical protein n=1 Tax=Laspinema palackyanum TaxID=3231601 RepID=UPI00349F978E
MSHPELLEKLQKLSHDEKLEIIHFLTTELAKEESLKALDNSTVYRAWSPYDYGDAAQKLMSLLAE